VRPRVATLEGMTTPAAPGDSLDLAHGPSWRNRLALAPLTNKQSHLDGTLSADETDWLVARAEGGFALTMTAAAYVDRAGNAWAGQLGVDDDTQLPGLRRLTDAIRAAGSVSSVQLHHAGRRADAEVSGRAVVAPWSDPDRGVRELSTVEVTEAVQGFVDGAVRAERAGFDGAEIHGAHGYLVCSFLDGRHNERADGWGGPLEDRMRFLLEVVDGIRAATGPDFQLGLRLTPDGMGITVDEGLETARTVLDGGRLDYLDMSLWDVRTTGREPRPGADLLIDRYAALDRGATRLGVAGKVLSAADVSWCLDRGVDFVLAGTAAIIHHDFASRVVADPGFVSTPQPVTAEHLRAERVGPAFIDYLGTQWDDFVA